MNVSYPQPSEPVAPPPAVLEYLGMRFHDLDLDGTIEAILGVRGHPFRFVVTPNVQHVVNFIEDPSSFAHLYEQAWLSVCDGKILPILARLSGVRLRTSSGSDLTARLIPLAAREGFPITVIGPTKEEVETLRFRFPGLNVQSYFPPFGFIDKESEIQKCLDFVAENPARLVFLAVGTPRQEILGCRLAGDPRASGVGLCIGASIDYLVGKQNRAPEWMQSRGLEWLYRLVQNPRRLSHRYLVQGPRILGHALRYEMARRR